MWIRVCGVKSGRLINFIVLPLGGAMVIDPIDFMCNHHLTPTRGGMETVNRNLNGALSCLERCPSDRYAELVFSDPHHQTSASTPCALSRYRWSPLCCDD